MAYDLPAISTLAVGINIRTAKRMFHYLVERVDVEVMEMSTAMNARAAQGWQVISIIQAEDGWAYITFEMEY